MPNRARRATLAAATAIAVIGVITLGVRGWGPSHGGSLSVHAPRGRAATTGAAASPGPGRPGAAAPTPRSSPSSASSSGAAGAPAGSSADGAAGLSPLTGLPVSAAVLHRPAIVVKIDNVTDALPQSGVDVADVVYEELVEGGLTRLAAVFQSADANAVGPVRSGRTTDIAIVSDLGTPLLAYSGANGVFEPELRAAPAIDLDASLSPGSYHRMGPHVIPHNLYTSTQALYAAAGGAGGTPPPLFSFRAPGAALGGAGASPASSVAMSFPSATVGWQWSPASDTWLRTQNGAPDVAADGTRLQATNIVVQSVGYQTVLEATGEGLPAPEPIPGGQLVGTGPAWVLSGGRAVAGTWSRPAPGAVTTYTDRGGQPIALSPGRTWVELLPTGSSPQIAP